MFDFKYAKQNLPNSFENALEITSVIKQVKIKIIDVEDNYGPARFLINKEDADQLTGYQDTQK
jgi:hypothetical protein